MSALNIHTPDSAPDGARPILAEAGRKLGFVPNLYGVFANSPAALAAYTSIQEALRKHARLTPAEQQVVMLAVSAENGCAYCVAAHSGIAAMSGVDKEAIASLRDERPIADPKLEALRAFTIALTRKRGWLEDGDLEAFLEAGYDHGHVLDVVAILGLKTISNYTNHLADTPLDDAFAAQRWEKSAQPA